MQKIYLIPVLAAMGIFSGCMAVVGLFYDLPDDTLYPLTFDDSARNPQYQFIFPDRANDAYSRELRLNYRLDSLTSLGENSLERAKIILNWAHTRFKHSGSAQPKKNDAISILKEAETGKNFRCVEYGIICAAALNSNGIPARALGLQTRDVETAEIAAGHVVTEAYLPDMKKWILLDPQLNVIPFSADIPLNAVEFQRAIVENKPIKLLNIHGEEKKYGAKACIQFAAKYLYFFSAQFDQRNIPDDEKYKVNGLSSLLLGPLSSAQPVLFQRKPVRKKAYTHSLADFYSEPVIR